MTFGDAVRNLRDGYATKRPAWGGYVAKNVTSQAGADVETYTLTFKKRDATTYVYTWNGSAWTAPSTTVPFDGEFVAAMLADDWYNGKTTDFELARAGTGDW